jgi:hypothetical protein
MFRKKMKYFLLVCYSIFAFTGYNESENLTDGFSTNIKSIEHITIYEDSLFYSCFPSVIRKHNKELLLAFRRAPNRELYCEENTHLDHNSNLVMVRSIDGYNWSKQPELIYAHPLGGSQDPCLLQLQNGTILCTSYFWSFFSHKTIEKFHKNNCNYQIIGDAVFMGGYIVKSSNGGKTWQINEAPPCLDDEICNTASGTRITAYNRGALYQDKNGRIYWAVAANDQINPNKTSVHLIVSDNDGMTWDYKCKIATDPRIAFNETSIYQTPRGDIVAFIRSENGGQAYIARSKDGGCTFETQEYMGFHGLPINALRLPDDSVLITYGYRMPPYGIRARILDAECINFKSAKEIVLRDDADSWDVGYTWPILLDDGKVLVVYYLNNQQGIRCIMGTIIEFEKNR